MNFFDQPDHHGPSIIYDGIDFIPIDGYVSDDVLIIFNTRILLVLI